MNKRGEFSMDTDMDDLMKWLLRILFFVILAGGLYYLSKMLVQG